MNEIAPITGPDQALPPASRAAQPERTTPAPLPEPTASAPTPSRTDQEAAEPANPSDASWLRRDRLWSFVKDKAEDLLERIASPRPDAASPAAKHREPVPFHDAAWSAISRPAAVDALPESLHKRYFIAENKFYYRGRGQALAFEDQGTRLITVHNDPDVARSMVELALAKDWTALQLKGTDEFKREAWLAASLRGLEVRGYRPTELDKARLSDELGRDPNANAIEPGRQRGQEPDGASPDKHQNGSLSGQEQAPPPAPGAAPREIAIHTLEKLLRARGDSEHAISMTTQIAADQLMQRRVYVGKLLDHGPARFDNKPQNEHSYYVHLDTGNGEKTVWGVDLQRAIASSKAQRGDDIVIAQQDSRHVTVPQHVRDSAGNPTGERVFIEAKRNDWLIRTVDGMREAAERSMPAPPAERQGVHRPAPETPTPEPFKQLRSVERDPDRAMDRTPLER